MVEGNRPLEWAGRVAVLLLLAHAIAYLTHEYAHSFLAWALGWMGSPVALDYGRPTLGNLLLLSDVADNVDYGPIIASGHGRSATAIALAGPFIGNGLLYVATYALARRSPAALRGWTGIFAFCFALMCAGNVWSYVPVRALTTHADIAIAAQGVGISTVVLLPFVLVPALGIAWHFFVRGCDLWIPRLVGNSEMKLALMCASTGFWFFAFFGGTARAGDYGVISQALSLLSVYLLFPISVPWLWSRNQRRDAAFATLRRTR